MTEIDPDATDPAATTIARIIHDALCTCGDLAAHRAKQVQGGWIDDVAQRVLAAGRADERRRIRHRIYASGVHVPAWLAALLGDDGD